MRRRRTVRFAPAMLEPSRYYCGLQIRRSQESNFSPEVRSTYAMGAELNRAKSWLMLAWNVLPTRAIALEQPHHRPKGRTTDCRTSRVGIFHRRGRDPGFLILLVRSVGVPFLLRGIYQKSNR